VFLCLSTAFVMPWTLANLPKTWMLPICLLRAQTSQTNFKSTFLHPDDLNLSLRTRFPASRVLLLVGEAISLCFLPPKITALPPSELAEGELDRFQMKPPSLSQKRRDRGAQEVRYRMLHSPLLMAPPKWRKPK
jgi:hypothetical protein